MNTQPDAAPAPPGGTRRIVLAEVAGFCFGVKRAVDMAEAARRKRADRITTLGPIIHNDQVIARMRADGIDTAPALETITEGTVILSAHGVAPTVLAQAQAQGLDILDVTCPFVTKVHRMAKQLLEQGYQLLLVGDQGHTEVRGVVGAIEAQGGAVTVVSTPEAVRALPLGRKVGVLSQTTQLAETFAAIVAEVCRRAADVRAVNTICGATDALQEAAARLARQVDVVLVIGGKKSANTRRLRQLCADQGVPAYHIETREEIEDSWLAGKAVIGITAGASTPDWLIEDVARHLNDGELPDDWHLHHPDE
jgi:4-hydroxy-3-methylbut-2-enyl diphosphate reductase